MPVVVVDPSSRFATSASSAQCVQWVAYEFAQGPLRFVLMHATADPQGVLDGAPGCRVLASARCILRSGTVYGLSLRGPGDALVDACCVLAAVLPQHGYDESFFSDVDREIADALRTAGYGSVRARLEHNAATRPRPVVAVAQVERLMLAVVNRQRVDCGDEPLANLTDSLRERFGVASGNSGANDNHDPAVVAYENLLDVYARSYMTSTPIVYGDPLDRLAVYNFIVGRAGKSRYRAQALRALPWILPLMTAPERGRILLEVVTIRAAIDEGESLHEAVARAFDVPREVVRWLSCKTLPKHWQLNDVRLRRLLAMLSWIPPERRPGSLTQFGDLAQLCDVLARIFRFRNDRGDLRMSAWSVLHGPCMRLWLAECQQHGWAQRAWHADAQGFAAECADASDFLNTLVEAVQDGRDTDDEAALALVVRWAAGISLRRLLDLSREWHVNAFAGVAAPADEPVLAAWPAILPESMCFNGVTAVELTSAAQLRAEGSLMQHCVASYDRVCSTGRSVIVSLRAASGAVLSTAELRLVGEEDLRVAVEQHRSVHNRAPGTASQRALEALVRYLNDGAAEPFLRARDRFQQHHRGRARLQQRVRDALAHQVAMELAASVAGGLPNVR